jgi:hypothetical protein
MMTPASASSKQTSGGVTEHYLMDGMETVAVLDANSDVLYWNILAGGVIGRRDASGASRYYVTDHLGSVRQQVDHTGAILSFCMSSLNLRRHILMQA